MATPTAYAFNCYGAVTQDDNPVQTFSYTYDDARRLTGSDPPSQRFAYDARGNLTEDSGATATSHDL